MSQSDTTTARRQNRRRTVLFATILSCGVTVVGPQIDSAVGQERVRRLPPVQNSTKPSAENAFIQPASSRKPSRPNLERTPELVWDELSLVGEKATELPNAIQANSQYETPLQLAARRRAEQRTASIPQPVGTRWLPSVTPGSCSIRAATVLDDAYREYAVKAYASAEASAWKALELMATGMDVADRQTAASNHGLSMVRDLHSARVAIGEAQEFVDGGAAVDPDRFVAIATSHQTPIFHGNVPAGVTATEAVDRYLDHARNQLAPLARAQVQAAQAMDLLAAVRLGRNQASQLPEEVALCLRRSALAGQPGNASLAARLGAQLADMGLDREAESTLQHAMSLDPSTEIAGALATVSQRRSTREVTRELTASLRQQMPVDASKRRVPDVIELTPDQFAAISPREYVAPPAPQLPPPDNLLASPPRVAESNARSVPTAGGTAGMYSTPPDPSLASQQVLADSAKPQSILAKLAGFRLPKRSPRTDQPSGSTSPMMTGRTPTQIAPPQMPTPLTRADVMAGAPGEASQSPATESSSGPIFDNIYPADAFDTPARPNKQPSAFKRAMDKLKPW
ncbi:MAG: hypothetical protein AAFV88_00610 [Planctomycetota bacterium]